MNDYLSFVGELPPYRVKSYTVRRDGEIIGIGGVAFPPGGGPLLFLHNTDGEQRAARVTMMRQTKRLLAEVRAMGWGQVFAKCDSAIDGADRFLERVGFRRGDGDMFVYEAEA